MQPQMLSNGNMLVPARAQTKKIIGDGVIEITPDDPTFDAWMKYLTQTVNLIRQGVGDYESIKDRYYSTMVETIINCLTGDKTISAGINSLKSLCATSFVDAFETGWIETGGTPYEPESEDSEWLANRQDQELSYLGGLGVTMKSMLADKDEPLTLSEIDQFAEDRAVGYSATLDNVYGQGKMRGKKSVMLTFTGQDGSPEYDCQKSNGTCVKLMGQRHRARWWISHDLIPGPGNQNYTCGGYNCQHYLEDDQGNRWAGVQP